MRKSVFVSCVFACLLALCQDFAHAASASTSRREAAVDRVFAAFAPGMPGCAVAVYRNGVAEFEKGYGLANLETLTPIDPHTVFDIGSTSKQFTAAAIVLLAEDGKLSLDDDVRKYLPEMPDYGSPVTIRQMLHHTAGLRDYVTLLTFADVDYDDVSTPAQALAMLARQKHLNYRPGESFLYSNSGYFLGSQIVERVSGMSMREFARQRIFAPLGMDHSFYKDDHAEVVAHQASGYAPEEEGRYRISEPNWEETGDGGVQTSVADLAHWVSNFTTPRIGGAGFVREMERTGTLNDGQSLDYALGLIVSAHRGRRMVHHGGSWGGYRAEIVRFPEVGLGVTALCNSANADASTLAIDTADLWLADAPMPAAASTDDAQRAVSPTGKDRGERTVAASAGTYRNPDSGSLRRVEFQDGLWIEAFGGRYRLASRPAGDFEMVGGPFEARYQFLAGPGGGLALQQSAMERTTRFTKLALHSPSEAELQGYAGDYDCEELGTVYRLQANGGELYRINPLGEREVFRPLQRREFSYGNLTMRFEIGSDGAARHALLDIGRVRGLDCPRMQ
ncbi:MAG TPA: serine hydrolase domain-containing protein [Stenotrophomonas sp.]|jgi:CubicO group peptidase (beta-lactamase class C family)